jgi:hypothetical protein
MILLFDAKTKKISTQYNKDLIGRSAQHALWAESKFPDSERFHYLVGPRVPATQQATPPPGIRVVATEELARIANAMANIYKRAADRNLPLFCAAEVEIGLGAAGLTWALLPQTMETVRLDSL